MRRQPFHILSAVSLLLCVAVVVLWVWSYAHTPGVVHKRPGRGTCVAAYRGRLMFETAGRIDTPAWPGWGSLGEGLTFAAPPSETLVIDAKHISPGVRFTALLGFQRYTRNSTIVPTAGWVTTVPFWFIAAVLTTPHMVVWGQRRRSKRRLREGRCSGCGYDLRATPERCPECGRVADLK